MREDVVEYFKSKEGLIAGHIFVNSLNSKIDEKGPNILIVGGTHGNEPSGVYALKQMHEILEANTSLMQKGNLHFLIANPRAFSRDKRYVDYDLNRSFDKNTNPKVYEFERQYQIKRLLDQISPIDIVLDIHSVSKGDNQIMVYNVDCLESRHLASKISPIRTHLVYNKEHITGLFIEECSRRGAVSIAIECGNHYDPNSTRVAFFHVYNLLKEVGILKSIEEYDNFKEYVQKNSNEITIYETIESIIPGPDFNFTKQDFITGSTLKKGELYATSEDKKYLSPEDCYIVMPPKKVQAGDHDAGFLCSKTSFHIGS